MATANSAGLGSFLKVGDLKKPVEVEIVDRATGPGLANGASKTEGKFGEQITLAFNVSSIPKRLSMPARGHDAKALETTFGPCGDGWIGKRVRISEDDNLSIMRVTPIG